MQERSKVLVASVIAATESVAEARGVGAVTVRAVARRAGVSLASVYEYFPTKEAILAAWAENVWERALDAGFRALEEAIVVRRLPVDDGMSEVVTAIHRVLRPFARTCTGATFPDPVGRSAQRLALFESVRSIIEGILLGVPGVTAIRVRSAPLASRLLAGILTSDGYMGFLAAEGDESAADLEVSDLFRRYLRGDVSPP